MRSIFVFLILFLFTFSYNYAGFSPDTVALNPQGFISIGQLQKGSYVTSYDLTKNNYLQGAVSNHRTYASSLACKVFCDDISFVASPDQIVMANKQWRLVKDLKKGDYLKCYDVSRRSGNTETDSSYAVVLSVEVYIDEQSLCEITIEPFHTFCVTPRGILVHNSPAIVISAAPVIVPVIAKTAGVVATIGVMLWHLLSKKKNGNKNRFIQDSSSFGCSSPSPKKPNDEDEFRRKHPHGRYDDVGYHKDHQSGRKSPRPIDGQRALDNSFDIPGKERTRVGFSQGQFVVLNETVEGVYHGHVRVWDELRPVMQNILKDLGIVTKRGKFIK
jgi:hypothetical protein